MKDETTQTYVDSFKDAIIKFNESETALYFLVQTTASHDGNAKFSAVDVYNKKNAIDWEATLLNEYCVHNTDLSTNSKVALIDSPDDKEPLVIDVKKRIIGFGIATTVEQVAEIISYMEADDRDFDKIYFYDYDLVIQELVAPQQPETVAKKTSFAQPINGVWGAFPPVTDGETAPLKPGQTIPGFEG